MVTYLTSLRVALGGLQSIRHIQSHIPDPDTCSLVPGCREINICHNSKDMPSQNRALLCVNTLTCDQCGVFPRGDKVANY